MKKSALGRGLGALISDADKLSFNRPQIAEFPLTPASISEIAVGKIDCNPFQPRNTFDQEALSELAESIRSLGLIQPITVRETEPGRYQIISGERRFRAAQEAGLEKIPAYIRKADDQGMLEMALVENIQRENLDAIEIALSFNRLIQECNLTQEEMAVRVGKKRTTVTNYLRLLKLPAEIQLAIRAKAISMGHARALLSLEDIKHQVKLCDKIIQKDLSVRETESMVKKISDPASKKRDSAQSGELDDSWYRLLEIFGRYFNNNISLKKADDGKGSITIRFSDEQEILNFLKALEQTNI